MWFFKRKKKPTSREVIEAIFSVFTEEELQSMMYEKLGTGEPDPGIKQILLKCADCLEPRYSIEESVKFAKEVVDPCRGNLLKARSYIFHVFTMHLFYH